MKPTPEQLSKLPKWAREQIANLESGCEVLKQELHALRTNAPSPFYEENIDSVKRYFQVDGCLTVNHGGVELEITARKSDGRIFLSWRGDRHSEVAFIPSTHQQAYLVSKENMR